MRILIQALLWLLPGKLRRTMLRMFFGYDIAPTARIGFSIVLAQRVSLGASARIGHLNVIKGLDELTLSERASIGNLNWVTGASGSAFFREEADRISALRIGRHAAITHRHLIDCSAAVEIGDYSTLAGWRTQLLTHSIDFSAGKQTSGPVHIGRYCFVGTSAILLKGSALPDYSVLSAGSVLTRRFDDEGHLYSGVPATPVRQLDLTGRYFTREVGFVS